MSNKAATKHRISTSDTRKIRTALNDVFKAARSVGADELATLTAKAIRATGSYPEMRRGGAENAAKFAVDALRSRSEKTAPGPQRWKGRTCGKPCKRKVKGAWSHKCTGACGQQNIRARVDVLGKITMAL